VAIEVDGGQHSEAANRDARRDEWLRDQGFLVLRFCNHEVLTQIGAVKEAIFKALNETPSPESGAGNDSSPARF
jgi:very-short-patch-repair endonuclease